MDQRRSVFDIGFQMVSAGFSIDFILFVLYFYDISQILRFWRLHAFYFNTHVINSASN